LGTGRLAADNEDGQELSELTLKYEQESLNGKPVEMLSIEARSSSEFETCLYLGLLQLLLEGRAMRRCEQCGEPFYAEQRRVNRRFCDIVCKDAYSNERRRRKHELAAR